MRLWDCGDLKQPVANFGGAEGTILRIAACAGGQVLAAACNDPRHSVFVWSTSVAGNVSKPIDPVARLANSDPITALSLTADGKYLIAGGDGEDNPPLGHRQQEGDRPLAQNKNGACDAWRSTNGIRPSWR